MDWNWITALGMLGVQALFAVAALVALRTPPTYRWVRRMHRRRVRIMVLGLFAAAWPLLYFTTHVNAGAGLYYLKFLAASVLLPVAQVALYWFEDQRRIDRTMDTHMRM